MTITERNNVQVIGRPDAPDTLLFAHGFGTSQQVWQDVAAGFVDTHRIVLLDNVGANDATVAYFDPQRYNHLRAYANDLLDIMEDLALRNVTFVGHSMGGMTGVLAALQEPDWFGRLVLLNASPHYRNEPDYVGGFDTDTLEELFWQMDRNFYAWASGFAPLAMRNPARPQLAQQYAQSLQAMRPDVALAVAKLIFLSDHRAEVAQLTHPTLLIQTANDLAVPPEVSLYLKQVIPNATLVFLDADGHYPHISAPDAVVKTIRSFLNELTTHGLEGI